MRAAGRQTQEKGAYHPFNFCSDTGDFNQPPVTVYLYISVPKGTSYGQISGSKIPLQCTCQKPRGPSAIGQQEY